MPDLGRIPGGAVGNPDSVGEHLRCCSHHSRGVAWIGKRDHAAHDPHHPARAGKAKVGAALEIGGHQWRESPRDAKIIGDIHSIRASVVGKVPANEHEKVGVLDSNNIGQLAARERLGERGGCPEHLCGAVHWWDKEHHQECKTAKQQHEHTVCQFDAGELQQHACDDDDGDDDVVVVVVVVWWWVEEVGQSATIIAVRE